MAGEPPAMVETMPVADETPAVSAPTAPTEEAMPPEKSRPKQEPAAKAAVPPRAKAAPEAPKPVERSEEHTSELQSLMRISYAVFCLQKKNTKTNTVTH